MHSLTQKASRPSFLITIDTEGDNLWARPTEITTRNSKFLERFQTLCEFYGFKPTYLTNYEMGCCEHFQEFGRDQLRRKTAEIGMHLHAWDSPPLRPLTGDDMACHPYLIEYAPEVMREKVRVQTDLLEETFGEKMVSHRAGRWAFNETYAQILVENGYQVDCSVTPYVSWEDYLGDPQGKGGRNYTDFPDQAYWLDLEDISKAGNSPLLEIPMTIMPKAKPLAQPIRCRLQKSPRVTRKVLDRFFPLLWLRPDGRNLRQMLRVLEDATSEGRDYVEFMLHSSEFMPAGSPTFQTEKDIQQLYKDLDELFHAASQKFKGATLSEYHRECQPKNVPVSANGVMDRDEIG